VDVGIDRTAAEGFAAGAGAYQRARPDYPADSVDLLVGRAPGPRILDVGAGTGKFTSLLAARTDEVFALEPVTKMYEQLSEALPGVPVVAATAEAIPFSDGSIDAVACAQAFHWFNPARSVAEFHRVLRPGGLLALVWNLRDKRVGWVDRVSAIVDGCGDTIRRHESGAWRADLEAAAGGMFTPLEESEFPNVQQVTRDQVLDRVASTSFIAAMSAEARAKVLDRVRAVLEEDPSTRGTFAFPHRTRVYCCNRV
jgi:SAM-dependent methyltransferase